MLTCLYNFLSGPRASKAHRHSYVCTTVISGGLRGQQKQQRQQPGQQHHRRHFHMCGSPGATRRRQQRPLRLLLLVAAGIAACTVASSVATAAAALSPSYPADGSSSAAGTATVQNESGLLAALAAPYISTVWVIANIALSADCVIPAGTGAAVGPAGEFVLTRNLTIVALPGQDARSDYYPVLDFTAVS